MVINVLAQDGVFKGKELLETLTRLGMTHGDMNIFHSSAGNQSAFSLANAFEPGTFDQAAMASNDFETRGVTLFMSVHKLQDPLRVFDAMLATAEALAQDLAGEVLDDTRSVMTPQTVAHYQQSILEFEFKHSRLS